MIIRNITSLVCFKNWSYSSYFQTVWKYSKIKIKILRVK